MGCRGVVYDLPGPAGTRAALYVVAREGIDELDTAPTSHPLHDGRLLCLGMARGRIALCPCRARRSDVEATNRSTLS